MENIFFSLLLFFLSLWPPKQNSIILIYVVIFIFVHIEARTKLLTTYSSCFNNLMFKQVRLVLFWDIISMGFLV